MTPTDLATGLIEPIVEETLSLIGSRLSPVAQRTEHLELALRAALTAYARRPNPTELDRETAVTVVMIVMDCDPLCPIRGCGCDCRNMVLYATRMLDSCAGVFSRLKDSLNA